MYELDRIERAFSTQSLNHQRFEQFAGDILTAVFPGLSAMSGGRALAIQLIINKELGLNKNENPLQGSFTDWSRGADPIHEGGSCR